MKRRNFIQSLILVFFAPRVIESLPVSKPSSSLSLESIPRLSDGTPYYLTKGHLPDEYEKILWQVVDGLDGNGPIMRQGHFWMHEDDWWRVRNTDLIKDDIIGDIFKS